MGKYHLVHANIAIMRALFDDPHMADFVAWADEIDALASRSPGIISQPTPQGMKAPSSKSLPCSIYPSGIMLKICVPSPTTAGTPRHSNAAPGCAALYLHKPELLLAAAINTQDGWCWCATRAGPQGALAF